MGGKAGGYTLTKNKGVNQVEEGENDAMIIFYIISTQFFFKYNLDDTIICDIHNKLYYLRGEKKLQLNQRL